MAARRRQSRHRTPPAGRPPHATPGPTAPPLVAEAIRTDPTTDPPADVAEKMFTYSINTPETDKLYTRLWTEVKTGR